MGWGPSLNLEQEKENFQNVLLPFLMFAFSLHLSLTVTSITFPVIFESIMDWSTSKKTFCAEPCDVSFHLGRRGLERTKTCQEVSVKPFHLPPRQLVPGLV